MRPVVHAITPGDHYSPRTGSAIPTVVHGIAAAALDAGAPMQSVLLDSSTYRPRYPSAEAIEYTGAPFPSMPARVVDAALGRLGLPRRSATRAFQPLADAMRDREPSFLLAHNAPALPRLMSAEQHRTLLYAHNDILRTMGHAEAHRSLDTVPAIVCVSGALAEITAGRLPSALADRIRVVENGVDTTTFHPAAEPSTGSRLRVMFLGRMIPDKGADVLLKAAGLLDRDDLEIIVVGSAGFDREAPLTPYEESLRRLASDARSEVVFERFVDRSGVPDLLRTADVFVIPSRWPDPSPLTVGEAMATGAAVIGSRIGGIPEVIGDAGVVVAPDAPAELAAAIEHLADDPTDRARLGAAARRRAEERSWANTWTQLQSLLAELA
ncbi:MAG: glycosyltransferase family 4 protein [Microbacteriaceae bacterium]